MPPDEELKIINSGKFIGFIKISNVHFPVFNRVATLENERLKLIVAPKEHWLTMEEFLGCECPNVKDNGYRYLITHGELNGNSSR